MPRLSQDSTLKAGNSFDFALTEEYRNGPIFEERLGVWQKRLADAARNQFVILAEEGGALTGFACIYGAEDTCWGSFLDNLHVGSGWQGRGLGKALFLRSARWCVERHPAAGMYLWVLDRNARARHMYEKLGAANVETNTVANINGGEQWRSPDGGDVVCHRYWWTPKQLKELARG